MTASHPSILVCVDGSQYTDSVSHHAAWISERLAAPLRIIHVHTPSTTFEGPADYSGTVNVDDVSNLLDKLAEFDAARGKLDMQKGELILSHVKTVLTDAGHPPAEIMHRHGALVETLSEFEASSQMVVLGKRGEHADFATLHLGANLERVVRAATIPVFVCSRAFRPIDSFAIAYDGGSSIEKAIDYVISSPLLQGMRCHLLTVGPDNPATQKTLDPAADRLRRGGFSVQAHIQPGRPEQAIAEYIETRQIGLLVMGAYGHSRIRNMVIGSTTSAVLRSCRIPVLLFR